MGDLFGDAPAADPAPTSRVNGEVRYTTISDWATFDQWLARIEAAELTALDTETTSLDEMRVEIVGISLVVQPGEGRLHLARAQRT